MALAELRRRIPIELEGSGEWRTGVREDRVIAGRSGGDFGDAAHANRVVVASGQHGLSRRGAQRRGMKAVVFQAASCQEFRGGRVTWTAKGARGAKARIINQDDQDIWRTLGRPQWRNRRERGLRILRIIGDQASARLIRDGENCSLNLVLIVLHREASFSLGNPESSPDADDSWANTSQLSRRVGLPAWPGNCQNGQGATREKPCFGQRGRFHL